MFSRLAAAQAKAETSHVSMNLTVPAGQSFRSYGEMKIGKSAEDTAMAMTVTGNTGGIGKVELRLVKQKFYISLGKLTSNKFVSIDLTDKSNPIAKQYGEIIENLDPARQVKQYQAAIVKFDNEGKPVKLHGVEAQPYKITIDPSKARQLKDMYQGLVKALVFGFLAAVVASYKGMNAKGGPKGVGDAVNESVVITFVMLFVVNFFISSLYIQLVPPKGM